MLYLQGGSAFTSFRLKQKLQQLQKKFPLVKSLEATYVYFVEENSGLDSQQQKALEALLPDSQLTDKQLFTPERDFWVVPRLGTISPWSSKATDIARICGLTMIDRIERGIFYHFAIEDGKALSAHTFSLIIQDCYDPLTESILQTDKDIDGLFQHDEPKPLTTVDILKDGKEALVAANASMGLSLNEGEIDYLYQAFSQQERNPTDAELMMFAQVNSEHCRHKIFNAKWRIDDNDKKRSLFSMIRNTNDKNPDNVLVAYKDNAAVLKGFDAEQFFINPHSKSYEFKQEPAPIVLKVETHNHPTAISPFPGAATGSGGEIRDEAATGRGARAKAGLAGFSVSHLHIPHFSQPWEMAVGKPAHIASPLDIMIEAPVGAASFNNEFGRPNLCGYFRTFESKTTDNAYRGYHKPIMIAGGIGNIRQAHVEKHDLVAQAPLIVLGGPAMAIGLGGGSASSRSNSDSDEDLDFASVQRSNPEMQRRAQEVINVCCALGEDNPILSVHDVGAGGLSNAMPELVDASDLGGHLYLRDIPNAEPAMSPVEIWCNEAQERFVLSIKPEAVELFTEIAARERCPFAVVGEATEERLLKVEDTHFNNDAVDIPMSVLFEDMPQMQRSDKHQAANFTLFQTKTINLADAVKHVLQFPCVADKSFLITIGDRSVGGLVARDQMVGPWQVPVADVAVTCNSFNGYHGEAMAMGERPPVALLNHAASARLAVGEAITNIAAAAIEDISELVLSANWMAAADYPGEGAGLYDAVEAIGMEMCPALGINIPVGKDSLSMRSTWEEKGEEKAVTSPLSLVITAAAKVTDIRRTLTPVLKTGSDESVLLLIDLGQGANRMGASVIAQSYHMLGKIAPDVDDPVLLRRFFKTLQTLNQKGFALAYHDRSDGGLLALICEMMFASHVGISLSITELDEDPIKSLFSEELGAVIQVKKAELANVLAIIKTNKLDACAHVIGELNDRDELIISHQGHCIYQQTRIELQRYWSETSYRIQSLRDNSDCAQQEFDRLLNKDDAGLQAELSFDPSEDITAPYINKGARPRVAILREQGVNGHVEMAAVNHRAGFESVDVHMSDLLNGRVGLRDFKGLMACGGFSYGDVLGAGRGWAQSILMHPDVRDQFIDFFGRTDTFALGVCNGCQMLAHLKALIPGADHWPLFQRNQSEQFEGRLLAVEIPQSPSLFFKGMEGSILPVVVAHGEGRAVFADAAQLTQAQQQSLIAMRYVDNQRQATEVYPANPNGSPHGITGLTSKDGRVTILMPHPERVFRTTQLSWHPEEWGEDSPWMRMFRNARAWVN